MLDRLRAALGTKTSHNGYDDPVDRVAAAIGAGPDTADLLRSGTWIDGVLAEDTLSRTDRWAEVSDGWPGLAQALRERSNQDLRAGALWLLHTLEHHAQPRTSKVFLWNTSAHDALVALARRKLGWQRAEVTLLWSRFAELANDPRWEMSLSQILRVPLSAAEELSQDERESLRPCIQATLDRIHRNDRLLYDAAERSRFTRRLTDLLDLPDDEVTLPETVLGPGDDFGVAVRGDLLNEFEPTVVVPLLRHLAGYTGAVTPGKKWRSQLAVLLAAEPARGEVARVLLERVCSHKGSVVDVRYGGSTYQEHVFVSADTAQLLRAAVWALRDAETGDVARLARLLGQAAIHCAAWAGGEGGSTRCAVVASSSVAALGELDGDHAVSQLARVQSRVRNKTLLKAVEKSLTRVAARAGLTPGQLLERSVPSFGLELGGRTERVVGENTAVLTAGSNGIKLSWRNPAGREVASVPKAVREQQPELLAQLRATVKEAGKVLATERARLEDLLATGRSWSAADWATYYLDHPITGVHACRLLWQAQASVGADDVSGDSWCTGLPIRTDAAWCLRTLSGDLVEVRDGARVRLWHPIDAAPTEVAGWREQLTEAELRQPFKQAFREVYLLTPAEEATDTYSNRFAAHVLRYPQAGALMRARGWSANHLGYWDGGQDGEAVKQIGENGWRARFFYDLIDSGVADDYGTPSLCASDQVRFERYDDSGAHPAWDGVALEQVPPLVFTEAMRDVDLFVGVTSIAADPTWEDRGEDRYRDYWFETSFGGLAESAQIRREALTRLMPRTRIADRVRVTERYLEVDGTFHTYKIHLGSGNILMSPNDAYLCIVAGRDKDAGKLFLPFEEDGGMLSLIVSKAFLLADDATITDRSITQQLRRR